MNKEAAICGEEQPVPRVLSQLQHAILQLEDTVGYLTDKISPALRVVPQEPAPPTAASAPRVESELTLAIERAAISIADIQSRLGILANRVEL